MKGIKNCLVRLSKCCNPVPGDEITGYITRGRGVTVHRKDCVNIVNAIDGENRLIDVDWYHSENVSYNAHLTVIAHDKPGLVYEVSNIFAEDNISLKSLNARATKEKMAVVTMMVEIGNKEQLNKIMKKLNSISGVVEINRRAN